MGYPQHARKYVRFWLVSAVIGQTPTYVRRNLAISGRSGGRAAVQVQITAFWLVASQCYRVGSRRTSSQCNSRGSSGLQAAAAPIILVHLSSPVRS